MNNEIYIQMIISTLKHEVVNNLVNEKDILVNCSVNQNRSLDSKVKRYGLASPRLNN